MRTVTTHVNVRMKLYRLFVAEEIASTRSWPSCPKPKSVLCSKSDWLHFSGLEGSHEFFGKAVSGPLGPLVFFATAVVLVAGSGASCPNVIRGYQVG